MDAPTTTPYGPVRFTARAGGRHFWTTWVMPYAVLIAAIVLGLPLVSDVPFAGGAGLGAALAVPLTVFLAALWRRGRRSWAQVTDTHLLLHSPQGFQAIPRRAIATAVMPRSWGQSGMTGEHVFFLGHDGSLLAHVDGHGGLHNRYGDALWAEGLLAQVARVAPTVVTPERLTRADTEAHWPGMAHLVHSRTGRQAAILVGLFALFVIGLPLLIAVFGLALEGT